MAEARGSARPPGGLVLIASASMPLMAWLIEADGSGMAVQQQDCEGYERCRVNFIKLYEKYQCAEDSITDMPYPVSATVEQSSMTLIDEIEAMTLDACKRRSSVSQSNSRASSPDPFTRRIDSQAGSPRNSKRDLKKLLFSRLKRDSVIPVQRVAKSKLK